MIVRSFSIGTVLRKGFLKNSQLVFFQKIFEMSFLCFFPRIEVWNLHKSILREIPQELRPWVAHGTGWYKCGWLVQNLKLVHTILFLFWNQSCRIFSPLKSARRQSNSSYGIWRTVFWTKLKKMLTGLNYQGVLKN